MVNVATVSIVLGMVVMLLSVAIVTGFRSEIENKLAGFGGHLEITNYDSNSSYESTPISCQQDFLPALKKLPGIKHVQPFAQKGGIIVTPTDNQGVLLKGVNNEFDWSFFKSCLTEGRLPVFTDSAASNEVLASQRLCRMLKLNIGDRIDAYFVQEPPRMRRFTIVGIFDTQQKEIDEGLIICDMRHIQRLNGWAPDQISGFEVSITDMDLLDTLSEEVSNLVVYAHNTNTTDSDYSSSSHLKVLSLTDRFTALFSWLKVLDTNVWVILSLTLLVAGFNMISGLLIMLLEKASMIGVLKALGMRNTQLQKLFIYRSAFIVLKGMIIGNIIGIGICLLQKHFAIIPLDPDNYFVSSVPINLKLLHILLLNLGAFIAILAALVIPSFIISRITPEKSIRME